MAEEQVIPRIAEAVAIAAVDRNGNRERSKLIERAMSIAVLAATRSGITDQTLIKKTMMDWRQSAIDAVNLNDPNAMKVFSEQLDKYEASLKD
jgi:hypothetical protein